MTLITDHKRTAIFFLAIVFATSPAGCMVIKPPAPAGPRSSGPPYPLLLNEDSGRKAAALVAFNQLAQGQASPEQKEIYLQPVTATIKSLPAHPGVSTYLPKFGSQGQMTEEETRESLRRFINNWQTLIGADPSQLSLVDRIDQPDGTKLANYEQRPSRYPLRGNYGKLQIQFSSDRRLVNLSSTCLPDADHWQSAIAVLTPQIDREAAVKHLLDSGASYRDSTGNPRIYPLTANNRLTTRELVIYVFPSKTVANSLELHLAWEIEVANAPFKTLYVDAVNGETITTG